MGRPHAIQVLSDLSLPLSGLRPGTFPRVMRIFERATPRSPAPCVTQKQPFTSLRLFVPPPKCGRACVRLM